MHSPGANRGYDTKRRSGRIVYSGFNGTVSMCFMWIMNYNLWLCCAIFVFEQFRVCLLKTLHKNGRTKQLIEKKRGKTNRKRRRINEQASERANERMNKWKQNRSENGE